MNSKIDSSFSIVNVSVVVGGPNLWLFCTKFRLGVGEMPVSMWS